MSRASRKADQEELLRRACEAQERQARALETIAGPLLMQYQLHEDSGLWTVEALYEDALLHGRGGDLP